MNEMKIGIASPVYLPYLRDYLDEGAQDLPEGLGGFSVTYLVQAMLQAGEKLSIYTLDPTITDTRVYAGAQLTVYVGPWRPRARNRILDLMRQERRYIADFIRQDQPDIVNAHWTYEFALGTIAATVPHLITVRDWSPTILRYQKHPYRFLRLLMDRECLRRGKNFSVNSPYLQKLVEKKIGAAAEFTPNAIPGDWFTPELKERKEKFTICSINNGFTERKNVSNLLRAFAQCNSLTTSELNLILVGEGFEHDGAAHKWAAANEFDENVQFLGSQSGAQVREIIDRSDLLMHPALEESFGMTLVEAMARRVPVIGGDSSGAVPWVLDDGKAGILIDVTSADAIAEAISFLVKDNTRWQQLSQAGYQSAKERFHADSVARLYLSIFQKILASN
jgi:glycosyltransferase involved in cell wall biosynthesis